MVEVQPNITISLWTSHQAAEITHGREEVPSAVRETNQGDEKGEDSSESVAEDPADEVRNTVCSGPVSLLR